MSTLKPQGTSKGVGKTSLSKQPDPVTVSRGRLKEAEPAGRGSLKHVTDVPLVCNLCVGQWRSGEYILQKEAYVCPGSR